MSLAAAMREHAPQYLQDLEPSESNIQIRRVLQAIMKCRTGALGGVKWSCAQCGHTHWTGRSCGNRHCATCGSEKTQAWLDKQSGKLLVGVHHFMVTFTVPQELRDVLRTHRRAGYEALMRASSSALIEVYKAKLADELRSCGLYDQVPAVAWTKKFVVDIEAVEDGRSVVAYLAPYVHRVAISNHRIKHVDAGSVAYEYLPSKTHKIVQRTVTGQQFVEGFTQHILPAGFRKVRYHGWMCSSSKTRLEEIRMLVWFALGWIYWMASAVGSTAKPSSCPKPSCPRCQGPMQVQQIEFQPVWLEMLNSRSQSRAPPPVINSS